MVAELRQLGGALGRTHDSHGARDMLDGSYLSFATSALMDPAAAPALEQELERVRRALAMYEVGQYLNFAERPVDVGRAFSDPALARLRELRARVDGRRLLHPNHPVAA
jgi:hypothetical protein